MIGVKLVLLILITLLVHDLFSFNQIEKTSTQFLGPEVNNDNHEAFNPRNQSILHFKFIIISLGYVDGERKQLESSQSMRSSIYQPMKDRNEDQQLTNVHKNPPLPGSLNSLYSN